MPKRVRKPGGSTEQVKRYRQQNRWWRPLEYARRRCSDIKHKEYHRYGGRGIKCTLTREEAIALYNRDNGHLLNRPSLDRKDPDKGYSFDNCRYIEWIDNIKDRRNPGTVKPLEAEDGWED